MKRTIAMEWPTDRLPCCQPAGLFNLNRCQGGQIRCTDAWKWWWGLMTMPPSSCSSCRQRASSSMLTMTKRQSTPKMHFMEMSSKRNCVRKWLCILEMSTAKQKDNILILLFDISIPFVSNDCHWQFIRIRIVWAGVVSMSEANLRYAYLCIEEDETFRTKDNYDR